MGVLKKGDVIKEDSHVVEGHKVTYKTVVDKIEKPPNIEQKVKEALIEADDIASANLQDMGRVTEEQMFSLVVKNFLALIKEQGLEIKPVESEEVDQVEF